MLSLQNQTNEAHGLTQFSTPNTEIKDRLRELWAQVLQDDADCFLDDDIFFEVGGDSVRSQQLIAAAAQDGILLTMEKIFMNPSLEEMASVAEITTIQEEEEKEDGKLKPFALLNGPIQATREALAAQCRVPLECIETGYACSPMQESLIAEFDDAHVNLYVRQFVFRLAADLPLSAFQRAWDDTIRANPVLRSRICRVEGILGYVQAVVDEPTLWSAVTTDLAGFLEQDVSIPMGLGDPFFRYNIVTGEDGARYFVWTAHHALCDGASIPQVLEEVAMRFQGQAADITPRAPYESFIESLHLEEDEVQRQASFWKQISQETNPTPYPTVPATTDFQVNPSATYIQTLQLEPGTPFGLTRALLLRAAWAILLSHYTGTEDVVFGAISNGRTAETARTTGPTINLLPIALHIDPKQPLAAFFGAVRAQWAEMMRGEHLGMSKIRQFLAGAPSTLVDFQTLFLVHPMEFADAIGPSMDALGLEYMPTLGKLEHHAYPLVVTCTLASETAVTLTLQHDERVVTAQQAEALGHQLQAILTHVNQASREALVGSISPLSAHDKAQIAAWNRYTPPTEETTLYELFERQCQRQPDALAVHSLERSLTYTEVDQYATHIARQLVSSGLQPGQFVAVCFEKSIWTVVAILAVFKAGGVYVPIERAHPRDRIAEIVQSAGISVALTSPMTAGVLDGLCEVILPVDGHVDEPLTSQVLPPANPRSTAYLLFTSGSTGKPKGILMSHAGISTSIVHHGQAFGAGPHWRTLQFGAHTFDLSIGEFFTTLTFGGCICIPSDEDRMNNLAGAITALDANTLLVVPTVANLLTPAEVPSLHTIVLAGEPITKETIVRWADHVALTAAYGPSETAVYCSGNLRVSSDAHPAHIGHAIGGTMWIANPDNHHQLCAVGCVGEILISGGLVGDGYLGDPAITEAAFVPAPSWLHELGGSNWPTVYRSGDLGRYNADGTFHIVGRKDTQVKLRGFRIELGEIENQIMAAGGVAAALSALPKQGPCSQQIVAVLSFDRSDLDQTPQAQADERFVLAPDRDSAETVRRLEIVQKRLARVLPEYMVPTVWVVLAQMPLLISGKIDRKATKQWIDGMSHATFALVRGDEGMDGEDEEIVPGSLADQLRQLWCDVLKVPAEHVTLRTSFFAIGGDSIAAIQVVSRAKQLGLTLSVRGIIAARALGNLVALVEEQQESSSSSNSDGAMTPATSANGDDMDIDDDIPSVTDFLLPYELLLQTKLRGHPAVTVDDAYAFSPMQREILRARQENPAVFLLSWQMEIASRSVHHPLSLERLARAWARVVQHFPILRSIFVTDPTNLLPPVQVVLGNAVPTIALAAVPETATIEPTFESLGIPAVDDCFLPHRALFSQRGGRFFLNIELDHLTIDGWSLKVIKTAFLDAYEAEESVFDIETAPSYKAFVAAHRLDRQANDSQYWANTLHNQPQALLPVSTGPWDVIPAHSPRKTKLYLPEIPAASLTAFSMEHGLTPATLFDAAWAQTLSYYTGQTQVGFEYVVSGRDEDVAGIFDMVGPLINVLAYHLPDVTPEKETSEETLADLAHRMQDQRAQDSLHSSVNLREVMDGLPSGRLFNTAVNFQRRPTAVTTETLWVDDNIKKSNDPWHFDILVRVMHITDDNTFRSSFEFDARRVDQARMEEVAHDFWRRVETSFS